MFGWLANAWGGPGLRKRGLFTAAILPAYPPGPLVHPRAAPQKGLARLFSGGGILTLLNLFSGSALSRFSLFALGIMPYVTASIILQLMTVVVPKLEQLQKEGEAGVGLKPDQLEKGGGAGVARINQYTRYLTVALAAAQSTGYAFLFKREGALV